MTSKLYLNSTAWRNMGVSDQEVKLLQGLVDSANEGDQEVQDLTQIMADIVSANALIADLTGRLDEVEGGEPGSATADTRSEDEIGELYGLSLMGVLL